MAPAGRCFTQEAAIQNALEQFRIADAFFLSERYHASASCEVSLHLLASSLYRKDEVHRCLHLLKKTSHISSPRLRLLQARCCVDLKEYAALPYCVGILTDVGLGRSSLKRLDDQFGDLACEVLVLLGHAKCRQGELKFAKEYYTASIERNPFLWSALEGLCYCSEATPDVTDMFVMDRVPSHFKPTATASCTAQSKENQDAECRTAVTLRPSSIVLHTISATPEMFAPDAASTPDRYEDLCRPVPSSSAVAARGVAKRLMHTQPTDGTPLGQSYPAHAVMTSAGAYSGSPPPTTQGSHRVHNMELDVREARQAKVTPTDPVAPAVAESLVTTTMRTKYATEKQYTAPRTDRSKVRPTWNPPAGRKLFTESTNSSAVSTPAPPTSPGPVTRAAARRLMQDPCHASMPSTGYSDRSAAPDESMTSEALAPVQPAQASFAGQRDTCNTAGSAVMDDLQSVAVAVAHAMTFKLHSAVSLFQKLPAQYRSTSYVLCKLAKACFECQRFSAALKEFKLLVKNDPYCIDGMATYSTCLWQLNEATLLSCLAHHLQSFAPDRPETWCAAGNGASLDRDSDMAVQFFEKAIKADDNFAYAHSLLGSELSALQKFDESQACFRKALAVCPKHFSAWFGLGLISFHRENFKEAASHFAMACKINGASSVVLTHVALSYNACGSIDVAKKLLHRASALNHLDPIPIFHLATISTRQGQYTDAVKLLEEMRQLSPKEALINYLLGKIYLKLGRVSEAKTHLAWASSIDSKTMSTMVRTSLGHLVGDDQPGMDSDDDDEEGVLSSAPMMNIHESSYEEDDSSMYATGSASNSLTEDSINDMSI